MEEIILKDYGWSKVIQRKDKYYIYFDGGGIVVKMIEKEISKEQAEKALLNQDEVDKIVRGL